MLTDFSQALKWHPDRHTTDKDEAQQKFIEVRHSRPSGSLVQRSLNAAMRLQINEAYTILLEYYQHRRRGSTPVQRLPPVVKPALPLMNTEATMHSLRPHNPGMNQTLILRAYLFPCSEGRGR